MYYNLIFLGFR